MEKYFTDAPVGYDGFGTITTTFTGYTEKGREIREVAILPEHKDWQLNRYYSGMTYLVSNEEEWARERESRTPETEPQSLAERVEGWMIEDFLNAPATKQTETHVMILAYEGERDGFKYESVFPKIHNSDEMNDELPKLQAIYQKAKEALENAATVAM